MAQCSMFGVQTHNLAKVDSARDGVALDQPRPYLLAPGSNRPFQVLDLYWSSPESGDVRYKSGQWRKTICSTGSLSISPDRTWIASEIE